MGALCGRGRSTASSLSGPTGSDVQVFPPTKNESWPSVHLATKAARLSLSGSESAALLSWMMKGQQPKLLSYLATEVARQPGMLACE